MMVARENGAPYLQRDPTPGVPGFVVPGTPDQLDKRPSDRCTFCTP